jgi:putative endonuclease
MNDSKRRGLIGRIGESVAAQFLESRGFTVLERNYRKPWGEIDIIALKRGVIRFVEVKSVSRESLTEVEEETNDHTPEEMVHSLKIRKIARTAEMYMNEKKDQRDFQIDVVGVFLDPKRRLARCRLYEQVL